MDQRPVAASVEELLDGARRLGPFETAESRSDAEFELVEVDGERCVVKYLHPDLDFLLRAVDDRSCGALQVWRHGLVDLAPDCIDHAMLGAAPWGRDGLGAALLLRDVGDALIPPGDAPISEADHLAFLDHIAGLSAAAWDFDDTYGLLPHHKRWAWFGADAIAEEEARGFPEAVPRIARDGWLRFAERVDGPVFEAVDSLRHDPRPLSEAILATPQTFLHGDWKLSNLGRGADGRTVLLDWAYPGRGPVCHDLGWYIALNRSRLPVDHTKESTVEALRAALERHGVGTGDWWDRQLDLCLLGTLVEFGWEKALGDDDELRWWCDRAAEGIRHL
ncbi:MAG: hypothetical protein U0Q22_04495 [Acidimicrobiales bacterium]